MTKQKIFCTIERMINEHRKSELCEFYGKNSILNVKTIGYSTNRKSLYVEAHITIGDDFSDEILDTSMAEVLIGDSLKYIYPNVGVSYIITWDV